MKLIEIIQEGDYHAWDKAKLDEIENKDFSDNIGTSLFENDTIKLHEIVLAPGERIPFRRHASNYSCTSLTDGLLLSRNINGQVALIRLKKGSNFFWECENQEMVHDLENVGEEMVMITVIEQKFR